MKTNKFIALLLAFSMIFTMIPMVSHAAATQKLAFVYGDSPSQQVGMMQFIQSIVTSKYTVVPIQASKFNQGELNNSYDAYLITSDVLVGTGAGNHVLNPDMLTQIMAKDKPTLIMSAQVAHMASMSTANYGQYEVTNFNTTIWDIEANAPRVFVGNHGDGPIFSGNIDPNLKPIIQYGSPVAGGVVINRDNAGRPIEFVYEKGASINNKTIVTRKSFMSLDFDVFNHKQDNFTKASTDMFSYLIEWIFGNDVTVLPVLELNKLDIHILEIQPSNAHYDLNLNMLKAKFGNNVKLTQMTMHTFNAKVEAINGKYDVIYLGNAGFNATTPVGYYPQGNAGVGFAPPAPSKVPFTGASGGGTIDNGTNKISEVIAGNDITNRASEYLYQYIESGQLIIFDSKFFDATGAQKKLNETLIHKNFLKYKDVKTNFVVNNASVTTGSSLSDSFTAYFQGYANGLYARKPKLVLESQPQASHVNGVLNPQIVADGKAVTFLVAINDKIKDQTIRLYFDHNGDGMYRPEEVVRTQHVIGGTFGGVEKIQLNFNLNRKFIGPITWKVEITDNETKAKNYQTGMTVFKQSSLMEPIKVIRVLQLVPNNNTYELNSNPNFYNFKDQAGLYQIVVTKLNASSFNSAPFDLNGQYDMLVMGFKDVVSSGLALNANAIERIKEFHATGQSIMMTHDQFMFNIGNNQNDSMMLFGREFRDLFGQNIYKKEYLKNDSVVNPVSWTKYDYDNNNSKAVGFTQTAFSRAVTGNFATTTSAKQVNESQMTMFPYDLKTLETNGVLPIANTHYQYYSLAMENPDLVVWYTLAGNYDATNAQDNYYVYSIGNITYSGTGHSSPNGLQENKLFINTMLKAASTANHAPEIFTDGIANNMEVMDDLKFKLKVSDEDLLDIKSTVKIYIQNANNPSQEILVYEKIHNNEVFEDVVLDMEKTVQGKKPSDFTKFNIRIEATDSHNALATKSFNDLTFQAFVVTAGFEKPGVITGDENALKIDMKMRDTLAVNSFTKVDIAIKVKTADYVNKITETFTGWTKTSVGDETILTKLNVPLDSDRETNLSLPFKFNAQTTEAGTNLDVYVTYVLNGSTKIAKDLDNKAKVVDGSVKVFLADKKGRPMASIPVNVKVNGTLLDLDPLTGGIQSEKLSDAVNGKVQLTNLKGGTSSYTIEFNRPAGYSTVTAILKAETDAQTDKVLTVTPYNAKHSVVVPLSYDEPTGTVYFSVNYDGSTFTGFNGGGSIKSLFESSKYKVTEASDLTSSVEFTTFAETRLISFKLDTDFEIGYNILKDAGIKLFTQAGASKTEVTGLTRTIDKVNGVITFEKPAGTAIPSGRLVLDVATSVPLNTLLSKTQYKLAIDSLSFKESDQTTTDTFDIKNSTSINSALKAVLFDVVPTNQTLAGTATIVTNTGVMVEEGFGFLLVDLKGSTSGTLSNLDMKFKFQNKLGAAVTDLTSHFELISIENPDYDNDGVNEVSISNGGIMITHTPTTAQPVQIKIKYKATGTHQPTGSETYRIVISEMDGIALPDAAQPKVNVDIIERFKLK